MDVLLIIPPVSSASGLFFDSFSWSSEETVDGKRSHSWTVLMLIDGSVTTTSSMAPLVSVAVWELPFADCLLVVTLTSRPQRQNSHYIIDTLTSSAEMQEVSIPLTNLRVPFVSFVSRLLSDGSTASDPSLTKLLKYYQSEKNPSGLS